MMQHQKVRTRIWEPIALLISVFALCQVSLAANHYIWCNATGSANGNDFTNAYTDLPSSLTRGDTYVIAGDSTCSFASHTFSDSTSSSTATITIRHAQASLDSAVAGWQSSFGTDIAQWNGNGTTSQANWWFDDGDYIIDGEFGAGENAGSYGFRMLELVPAAPDSGAFVRIGGSGDTISTLTFRHLEIDGGGWVGLPSTVGGKTAFFGSSGNTVSNITFQYCYLHDVSADAFDVNNWSTVLIEHSVVARIRSTASEHAQAWQSNPINTFTDRYNVYEDIEGTGVWVSLNKASSDWQIYGDVVFDTPSCTGCGFGNGVLNDNNGGGSLTGLQFYNNTIAGLLQGTRAGIFLASASSSNVTAYNNLWWNNVETQITAGGGSVTHDYNTFLRTVIETSNTTLSANEFQTPGNCTIGNANCVDPFLNDAQKNFRLSGETVDAHLNDGIPLTGPTGCTIGVNCYNVDPDGKIRGGDPAPNTSTWERGAYEYLRPEPPANARVTGVH
jgi:hypothetical protein